MHSYPILTEFLTLLTVAIPISFLLHKFKLPSIVAFLLTGMIVGPDGAGWVSNSNVVESLAQVGVILLLFTIGVQFSLGEVLASGRKLATLGFAQIVLTLLAAYGVSRLFGFTAQASIFIGFFFSLGCTAMVVKLFADRAETDSPQGKLSTGLLLFQDLSAIPMMLILPALYGESTSLFPIFKQLVIGFLTVTVLLIASRYLVPLLLRSVLSLHNRDLFLIAILFVCLITAYGAAATGLSLAIGAFIAGLVISESAYSYQVLADILPFRDIFNFIFFVSVGMFVNSELLLTRFPATLLLGISLMIAKTVLLLIILLVSKTTFRISLITAAALSQVGEFSFLFARDAVGAGLIDENTYQYLLSASVISMILTPVAIQLANFGSIRLQEKFGLHPEKNSEKEGPGLRDHVLIIGYGLNGQNLSRVVKEVGIPYIVMELNDSLVRKAKDDGVPVLFGDATRKGVLIQGGAVTARISVVAISDPVAARTCVTVIRNLNPKAYILVRTRYVSEVERLTSLGADLVIPEEFETSVEIFSRVLREYNIPDHLIEQQISIIRSGAYGMLRGLSLSHERLMQVSELLIKSTIEQVILRQDSPAISRSIRQLDLRGRTGATVLAVIRDDKPYLNPEPEFVLQQDDLLVLWGAHSQLAQAMEVFGVLK